MQKSCSAHLKTTPTDQRICNYKIDGGLISWQ